MLITVGSGLLMATLDEMQRLAVPVCCAVDAGELTEVNLIRGLDYMLYAHPVVGVHIWRSRGDLTTLYPLIANLQARNRENYRIVWRLCGNGQEDSYRYIFNEPTFDSFCRLIMRRMERPKHALEAIAYWNDG